MEETTEKRVTYIREVEVKYKKGTAVKLPIINSRSVFEMFNDLQNETKEKFIVIGLNVRNQILCYEVVSIGSVTEAVVKPSDALRVPIMLNAVNIILVHNHPSGVSSPSQDDKDLTNKIQMAADLFGINVLDHVIIGNGEFFSFADEMILWKKIKN